MRAGWRWLLALAGLLAGCHRTAMPPRPDGAAVVITAETQDDGIATVPEVEPNNTLPTAQLLAVTATTPAAVAGAIGAQPPAGKRDVDLYRVDVAGPDAGVAPSAGDAGAAVSPPRLLLRADLRPTVPGLAATLEVLDATGHVLVAANGQPGEAIAIPNLAARGGSFYLRVRAAGAERTRRGWQLSAGACIWLPSTPGPRSSRTATPRTRPSSRRAARRSATWAGATTRTGTACRRPGSPRGACSRSISIRCPRSR